MLVISLRLLLTALSWLTSLFSCSGFSTMPAPFSFFTPLTRLQDATLRSLAHLARAYSPKCVAQEFSEVQIRIVNIRPYQGGAVRLVSISANDVEEEFF